MKISIILTIIFLILLFNAIVFSLIIGNPSTTGKAISEDPTNPNIQLEQQEQTPETTAPSEQIPEQQTQEERCDWGYSGKQRCDGKTIETEWVSSDCSSTWLYSLECYSGCEDGECTDKPTQEPQNEPPQEPCKSDLSTYYKVTRVIDGDTIEIEGGESVRLICIDTPERGEERYLEATHFLEDLILNKRVELVKDISERDKYNRLLRYIYLDGDFINKIMVEEGLAEAYPYRPDTTLCPQIQSAEVIARNKGIGIWKETEEPDDNSPSDSDYTCSSNAYNCGDFSTQAEAQAVFEACGGVSNDIHRLDRDKDGSVCETLP